MAGGVVTAVAAAPEEVGSAGLSTPASVMQAMAGAGMIAAGGTKLTSALVGAKDSATIEKAAGATLTLSNPVALTVFGATRGNLKAASVAGTVVDVGQAATSLVTATTTMDKAAAAIAAAQAGLEVEEGAKRAGCAEESKCSKSQPKEGTQNPGGGLL